MCSHGDSLKILGHRVFGRGRELPLCRQFVINHGKSAFYVRHSRGAQHCFPSPAWASGRRWAQFSLSNLLWALIHQRQGYVNWCMQLVNNRLLHNISFRWEALYFYYLFIWKEEAEKEGDRDRGRKREIIHLLSVVLFSKCLKQSRLARPKLRARHVKIHLHLKIHLLFKDRF